METINAWPCRWERDTVSEGEKFAKREAAAGRQKQESQEEKETTRDAIAISLAFLFYLLQRTVCGGVCKVRASELT